MTAATTDMVLLLHRLTLLLVPYLSSATNWEGYAKASPIDLWSAHDDSYSVSVLSTGTS
eukprot:CAMPEP_0170877162 /NCGR_PEP_ID=MMETSP0734-20130129/30147_1 /TAXON_ID=186038 /ORGANISM="Fragilariopsis kerguelensis, Strain L26-C5" /LENGTH=58 /DNA_ID=CAMNT_0011259385 /DNA_START=122 /DNA_END=295 /DNA_ORIENTATION=-